MYSPTTRLLTVLELLQSRGSVSGPELAEKLEVEVRSVRRYITMLRDLGIPVESEAGRYGTYYLRPGFRLPPLMFNHTEILAVILGLMTVRQIGLASAPGVESAAAKIERVLPDELRQRVRAVERVLTLDLPAYQSTASEMITLVSMAAYQRSALWLEYQSGRGEISERRVDVYGVVYHTGYWYAVGYCHLRADIRSFRLDRVRQARQLDASYEAPPDFDALGYLMRSIASLPGAWRIEVLLQTTLYEAKNRVPPDTAVLEETADGVLMSAYSDGLDWIAHFLIGLRCPFRVIKPPELRAKIREIAGRLMEMAGE